jgi:hypothetical protein
VTEIAAIESQEIVGSKMASDLFKHLHRVHSIIAFSQRIKSFFLRWTR